MNKESDFIAPEVAIVKGDTPKSTVIKGIDLLGGISKFINKEDEVFIKFNLFFPAGFPTNTNFDVLQTIITRCKEAGARKIRLGSFPFKSISISTISEILNLEQYFRNLGAEFTYLDNSDFFYDKKIKKEQLEQIRKESFSEVVINENKFLIPKVIINSDKLIIVNQVNVNPIFKLNFSLLNSYFMVPQKYRKIEKKRDKNENYLLHDQFKLDLISNILDIFTIKQPNLVINDLYYLLEGAGPFIYKDSNLKKTGIMVLGNNSVSVDLITLKLLNIDIQDCKILLKAHQKELGTIDPKKITLFGENVEDFSFSIELCHSKLEDIHLKNFKLNSGQICSGCFSQAYHLLNIMKSHMAKDLKYNPRNFFLAGINPSEPERFDNVLVFGDCAIKSTQNSNFREIRLDSKKASQNEKKPRKKGEKGLQKKDRIKVKMNKNILEFPGCPPDIINCLEMIYKYYGRKNLPNLSLLNQLLETIINPEVKEKLRIMGVI